MKRILFASCGLLFALCGLLPARAYAEERLPLQSPVLAGTALVLFVAAPLSVACWWALHDDDRTDQQVAVAGGLLVVWILGQLAVLRTFSWLQPAYLVCGAVLVVVGARHLARR